MSVLMLLAYKDDIMIGIGGTNKTQLNAMKIWHYCNRLFIKGLW